LLLSVRLGMPLDNSDRSKFRMNTQNLSKRQHHEPSQDFLCMRVPIVEKILVFLATTAKDSKKEDDLVVLYRDAIREEPKLATHAPL
jgi:hypothetical protein